jgi:hypothetical protein
MTGRKSTEDTTPQPYLSEFTRVWLDGVDGQPLFADGMSRRRWLAANEDERKAAALAALKAGDDEALRELQPLQPGLTADLAAERAAAEAAAADDAEG